MIDWKPFSPKALDFIRNSNARLNIMYGSVRSSKTVNCTVRWLDYLVSGPGGDLAMVGKTTATLQRNVLNDMFDIVGPANYKWINRMQGELRVFNRRVYCFGANNEDAESKIRGATFAGALCDEVNLYPQSVFNQLMARLSVSGAKCFCNCNPDSPYHWFNTDYILNDDITDKKVWKFLMDDNPSLDQEYVRSLKQMYKGVWYDRMINGDWVAAEGRVYSMYEPEKHKIDTNEAIIKSGVAPEAIRWLVGCDYGTSTVMSWGLYAKMPDGTTYKVKEFYWDALKQQIQKTDSEFANEFVKWVDGYTPNAIYVDPSAASWKLELMRRGYRVLNADNDVINGIRYVSSQLSLGKYFIDKSCKNTDMEYVSYAWDPVAQMKGLDKPLKVHDHACLSGDTLVWTTEGKKKIEDLVGTEGKCFCYDFNGKEFTISDFFNVQCTNMDEEIYELELKDGRFVHCTADHKFFTRRGKLQLNELTTHSFVGVYKWFLAFVRVKNVKKIGRGPVYNMTVDKYHNYIVNDGIITKNCDTDRYALYTSSLGELSGVYSLAKKRN